MSDLWQESDSDSEADNTGGASGRSGTTGEVATTAPFQDHEADSSGGHQAGHVGTSAGEEDSDSDDFGAFGQRAMASHHLSMSRSVAGKRVSPHRSWAAKNDKAPPGDPAGRSAVAEAGGVDAEALALVPLPVTLLGFPSLRQLTVKGTPELTEVFAEALARMAPPSLRRVDCRGCSLGRSASSILATAISRRERQAFAQLVEIAAAETSGYPTAPAAVVDPMLDDLSAVVPGALQLVALGVSDSLAGIESAASMSTAALHSRMPSEYEVELMARGQRDADALVTHPTRSDMDDDEGEPCFRALGSDSAATEAARPSVTPTVPIGEIVVASGSSAPCILGRTAVDAIENRGLMLSSSLDRIVDWACEHVAIDGSA